MGFLKRLLGLETKPGEPKPVDEARFESEVLGSDLPCFVYFYNLWCASCQVTGGLLNEVGPGFVGRAEFFKIDTHKAPSVPARFNVRGVPAIIAIRAGREIDRLVGLTPIDSLTSWIEKNIDSDSGNPGSG